MLNNIKISQTTEEIVLNVNIVSDIEEICEELESKIVKLKEFYKSAKTPIRITGKLFTESEIERIKKIIENEIDVEIAFDEPSNLLGLHAIKKTFQTETEVSETKYVRTSLRSGQVEEYSGSIVIMGDVNAGGEVIAGGNIAIIGALRGLAHAGAGGNTKALITANSIDSTQIRIANLVKEVEARVEKCPVCKIEGNEIKVI
jgi:septum site-determining protein MinC